MCNTLGVDPLAAAKVMVAVASNESGLTLTFERPTEANVALAFEIKVPDLYVTFHDRLVKEYKQNQGKMKK